MIWDADPIMLDLGFVSIRWYGFLFSLGFLAGYAQMKRIYIREMKPLEDFDRLLLIMLVSTIVGARLGHCLFYDPAYYLSHPLEILRIWRGGLASHGGAIGILIGLYIFTRKRPSQPYPWLLDRIAIPTALAGCFIRVGNFFNSEILGEPTEVPWAVTFARIDLVPRHPAMLYEAAAYLMIFSVLATHYRRIGSRTPSGRLLGLFLLLVFLARFLIEFVKVDQAAWAAELPLSAGQILSLPAIAGGAVLLWRSARTRRTDAQSEASSSRLSA